MWTGAAGSEEPVHGKHFLVDLPLNSPQSIARPHPPILVGGDGERRTLPLVARYANACSLRPGPGLPRKLELLRRYCDDIGRDYDQIRKTCVFVFDVGPEGERATELVGALKRLADTGIDMVIGRVADVDAITPLDVIGREVIPAIAEF